MRRKLALLFLLAALGLSVLTSCGGGGTEGMGGGGDVGGGGGGGGGSVGDASAPPLGSPGP